MRRVLAWPRRCDAADDADAAADGSERHACVVDDLAPASARTVPVGRRRLAGVRDGALLLMPPPYQRGEALGPALVDVATGEVREVEIPDVDRSAQFHARWLSDGTLLVLCAQGERRRVVLVTPHGTRREVALPERASWADFADARRGVATFAFDGSLWKTSDGGETWARAAPPVDGLRREGQVRDVLAGNELWCAAEACVAFGNWVVRAWDERPAEEVALLRDTDVDDPPGALPGGPAWTCAPDGAAVVRAVPLASGTAVGAGYAVRALPGGRWGWFDGVRPGPTAASGPVPPELRIPGPAARVRAAPWYARVLVASDRALLLERCMRHGAPEPDDVPIEELQPWAETCTLWWVRPGEAPERVDATVREVSPIDTAVDLRRQAVAWLDGERGAVAWVVRGGGEVQVRGATLGPEGVRRLETVTHATASEARLLAVGRVDGQWSAVLAFADVPGAWRIPFEGPARVPALLDGFDFDALPICAGAPTPGASLGGANLRGLEFAGRRTIETYAPQLSIEPQGGGWCVRSAAFSVAPDATSVHARLVAGVDGVLGGRAAQGGASRPFTCRAAVAPSHP